MFYYSIEHHNILSTGRSNRSPQFYTVPAGIQYVRTVKQYSGARAVRAARSNDVQK